MSHETLQAKLRNQLTPLYSLVDLILLIDENPALKALAIKLAQQAKENKSSINTILDCMDAQRLENTDIVRTAFDDSRKRITHPDWDYVYEDFDEWLKKYPNTNK